MKILLPYIFFLFMTAPSFSQAIIQWKDVEGGGGEENSSDIKQTPDGGYVVLAQSTSTNGPLASVYGNYDLIVRKLNACLQTEWTKTYGGSDNDFPDEICVASDGGYIIAAATYSNDGVVSGNHGEADMWILKLNANGDLEWQRCFGSSANDYGHDIMQLPDGGYIVLGHAGTNNGDVTSTHGQRDIWLVRLDATGNIIWQKTFGGPGTDDAYGFKMTGDDGYIIAGNCSVAGGDVLTTYGAGDFWIIKVGANGELIWQRTLGGTGLDGCADVRNADNGSVIVYGHTNSTNGDITQNLGQDDVWIIKLDRTGQLIWQRSLGGSSADGCAALTNSFDNGFIGVGYTQSNDIDAVNSHVNDVFVFKLDKDGNKIWTHCYGGSRGDFGINIETTWDHGYLVGGFTASNDGDFEGVTVSPGFYDMLLFKLFEYLPSRADTTICYNSWFRGNTYTADAIINDTLKTHCGFDSAWTQIFVKVLPPAQIFQSDTSVCYGNRIGNIIVHADTALFDITRNHLGCDSIIRKLNIHTAPVSINAGNDTLIVSGTAAQLHAIGTGQVYWQNDPTLSCTNCNLPVASPVTTTIYTVFAQIGNCTASDNVKVEVISYKDIFIPTAFSPNGDGKNDVFKATGYAKNFKMVIYNRWGQTVFESRFPGQEWDGKLNGVDQPVGAYVFYCEYVSYAGDKRQLKGTLILTR